MPHQDLEQLAELATSQGMVFTTAQAQQIGIDRLALSRLAKRGKLERMAQGVYRIADNPPAVNDQIRVEWMSTQPQVTVEQRLDTPSIIVGGMTAAFLWGYTAQNQVPYQFYTKERKQTQRSELQYLLRDFGEDDYRRLDGLPVARIEYVIADLVRRGSAFSQLSEVLKAVKDRMVNEPDLAEQFDWDYLDRIVGDVTGKEWFTLWRTSTRILSQR